MGDELVAGVAELVGVMVAGEVEGVGKRVAIDSGRRIELLDHREEIGEELALL
jgi:hypothetical protein